MTLEEMIRKQHNRQDYRNQLILARDAMTYRIARLDKEFGGTERKLPLRKRREAKS